MNFFIWTTTEAHECFSNKETGLMKSKKYENFDTLNKRCRKNCNGEWNNQWCIALFCFLLSVFEQLSRPPPSVQSFYFMQSALNCFVHEMCYSNKVDLTLPDLRAYLRRWHCSPHGAVCFVDPAAPLRPPSPPSESRCRSRSHPASSWGTSSSLQISEQIEWK